MLAGDLDDVFELDIDGAALIEERVEVTPAEPDLRRGLSECSLRLFPVRVFPNCSIRTLEACS